MRAARITPPTATRAATSGDDWPRSDCAIASPIMPVRPTVTAMVRAAVAAWAGGGSVAGGGNVATAPAAPLHSNPTTQPETRQLASGKLARTATPAYAAVGAHMRSMTTPAGSAPPAWY